MAAYAVAACQTIYNDAWIAPDNSEPPVLSEKAKPSEISDWKRRYLQELGYIEASSDSSRVTLVDPRSVELAGEYRTAILRSELYRPRFSDGHWLRSVRKKLLIDCERLQYRELELAGFAGSNLRAEVPGLHPPNEWIGPFAIESSAGAALGAVCSMEINKI